MKIREKYVYTEEDNEHIMIMDKKIRALPKLYRIFHESALGDLTKEELMKYEASLHNHLLAEHYTPMPYATKLRMTGLTPEMYEDIVENANRYLQAIVEAKKTAPESMEESKLFSTTLLDKLLEEREDLYRHGYKLGYRNKALFEFIRLMYNEDLNNKYAERFLESERIEQTKKEIRIHKKRQEKHKEFLRIEVYGQPEVQEQVQNRSKPKEEDAKIQTEKRVAKAKETRRKNRERRLAEIKKAEERANNLRAKYFGGYK